jgi:hypothetical protein
LSVRPIAAATGLSSSRVHQFLGSDEAREISRNELAGYTPIAAEGQTGGKTAAAPRPDHGRRLAEPDPAPKRMTVQEERAALWDALAGGCRLGRFGVMRVVKMIH